MSEVRIPTAADCMSAKYLSFAPDFDILKAIEKMARKSASGAIVLDAGAKLQGILTEKDCLRILTLSAYHEARAGKVSDFMSPVPNCATPGMGLFRVSSLFLDTHFPLIPVMEGEKVVGVITRQHMLKAIEKTAHKMEAEYRKTHEIEDEAEEITDRPRSIQDMQDVYSKSSRDQLVRRIKRKS